MYEPRRPDTHLRRAQVTPPVTAGHTTGGHQSAPRHHTPSRCSAALHTPRVRLLLHREPSCESVSRPIGSGRGWPGAGRECSGMRGVYRQVGGAVMPISDKSVPGVCEHATHARALDVGPDSGLGHPRPTPPDRPSGSTSLSNRPLRAVFRGRVHTRGARRRPCREDLWRGDSERPPGERIATCSFRSPCALLEGGSGRLTPPRHPGRSSRRHPTDLLREAQP